MLIQVMVHNKRLCKKASKDEIPKIVYGCRLRELTLVQICQAIQQGQTIRPGIIVGDKISDSNWQCQQLLFVDLDDGQTVNSTLIKCNELGLEPSIVYPTFSYTCENQKHRLVFCLDKPVFDIETRNTVMKKLCQLFSSDKNALRPTQLFFGSRDIFLFDNRSRVSIQQILGINVEPTSVEQLTL